MTTTDATPLELIERTVLEHAKGIHLDLDDDAARARMHELITDAVARWSADYRRGLRTHDLADPELVVERAYRNLVGYGPLEGLLADDDVWEVMINAPDATFQQSRSTRSSVGTRRPLGVLPALDSTVTELSMRHQLPSALPRRCHSAQHGPRGRSPLSPICCPRVHISTASALLTTSGVPE